MPTDIPRARYLDVAEGVHDIASRTEKVDILRKRGERNPVGE
jgi:hypothetical protein